MTAKMLLEQYMAERHALGFVSKTDEGCIRRFLRDYKEPEDGKIVFSKEYVLEHIGTGLNQIEEGLQMFRGYIFQFPFCQWVFLDISDCSEVILHRTIAERTCF